MASKSISTTIMDTFSIKSELSVIQIEGNRNDDYRIIDADSTSVVSKRSSRERVYEK